MEENSRSQKTMMLNWKQKWEKSQRKLIKYSEKQLYQQERCLQRTRGCFSEKAKLKCI